MAFDLEKLFVQVFGPQDGDRVTILCDRPHGDIPDNDAWKERREMVRSWHRKLANFSQNYGVQVMPMVEFPATGTHGADLPEFGVCQGERVRLRKVMQDACIVFAMTQFSASAPLLGFARAYDHLRIASLPMVSPAMEETGLSADWEDVAVACAKLAPLFEESESVEVTFSTEHRCTFDISNHNQVFQDNGLLAPGSRPGLPMFANLPAGEVFTVPNEAQDSGTAGKIPVAYGNETVVFVVKRNRIVEVQGEGPIAKKRRQEFREEPVLCNIAEVAIGCNDKAVVTGNPLEDEKAGFHWAYGRSEHLGGTVGPERFSAPGKVSHIDIVYAKGNPIECARCDFVLPDGTRKTAIIDGVRCV
jgi:hypothetical protein